MISFLASSRSRWPKRETSTSLMMYWSDGRARDWTSTAAPNAPLPTTRILRYLSIWGASKWAAATNGRPPNMPEIDRRMRCAVLISALAASHAIRIRPPVTMVAMSSSETAVSSVRPAERYVATNRFQVKKGREAAFEKRWADRKSRLGLLDGFRFFCMMRRVESDCIQYADDNNYISCTVWQTVCIASRGCLRHFVEPLPAPCQPCQSRPCAEPKAQVCTSPHHNAIVCPGRRLQLVEERRRLQGGARGRHRRRDRVHAARHRHEHKGQAQGGHVGGHPPGDHATRRGDGVVIGMAGGCGRREGDARRRGLHCDEPILGIGEDLPAAATVFAV